MDITFADVFLNTYVFYHLGSFRNNVYKNIRLKSIMREKVTFIFVCIITKFEIRNIKIFD